MHCLLATRLVSIEGPETIVQRVPYNDDQQILYSVK